MSLEERLLNLFETLDDAKQSAARRRGIRRLANCPGRSPLTDDGFDSLAFPDVPPRKPGAAVGRRAPEGDSQGSSSTAPPPAKRTRKMQLACKRQPILKMLDSVLRQYFGFADSDRRCKCSWPVSRFELGFVQAVLTACRRLCVRAVFAAGTYSVSGAYSGCMTRPTVAAPGAVSTFRSHGTHCSRPSNGIRSPPRVRYLTSGVGLRWRTSTPGPAWMTFLFVSSSPVVSLFNGISSPRWFGPRHGKESRTGRRLF